jgi:hypothetical protein
MLMHVCAYLMKWVGWNCEDAEAVTDDKNGDQSGTGETD